jgi:hypothetical protein
MFLTTFNLSKILNNSCDCIEKFELDSGLDTEEFIRYKGKTYILKEDYDLRFLSREKSNFTDRQVDYVKQNEIEIQTDDLIDFKNTVINKINIDSLRKKRSLSTNIVTSSNTTEKDSENSSTVDKTKEPKISPSLSEMKAQLTQFELLLLNIFLSIGNIYN